MIEAKKAVQIAREQMTEWFSEEQPLQLELEEVELSEDDQYWFITIGYNLPNKNPTSSEIMRSLGDPPPDSVRQFKVFKIDSASGKVRSMKMRDV